MVCDICRAAGENARAARMVDLEGQEFVFQSNTGRELAILAGPLITHLATLLHELCPGEGQCDCQHFTDVGVNV